VIRAAVDATMRDNPEEDLEDVVLRAANELPADASDFDRGMAAGFAAAMMLALMPQCEKSIS